MHNGKLSTTIFLFLLFPTLVISSTCREAPLIANSRILFIDTGLVVYGCRRGYDLVGSKTIICQDNGLWSERPYCERVTIAPPLPATIPKLTFGVPRLTTAKAVVEETPATTTTTSKPTTTLSTPPPAPTTRRLNLHGCQEPPHVENAEIVFEDPGVFVSYACSNGLVLVGEMNIFCNGNTWSEPPMCIQEKSCGQLPYVNGAIISESNLIPGMMSRVGSFAVFSCPESGVESQRTECTESGTWSLIPSCERTVKPSTPPGSIMAPKATPPSEIICPSAQLTHLIFILDLVNMSNANQHRWGMVGFLESLNFRSKIQEHSMDPNSFTVGAVSIFETLTKRIAVKTSLTIDDKLTRQQVVGWVSWLDNNFVLLKNVSWYQIGTFSEFSYFFFPFLKAVDDDVVDMLETVPSFTGLNSLNNLNCERGLATQRVVYVSNAKRGAAIMDASVQAQSIKRAGGKIFALGFGTDMGSPGQQTLMKTKIATQNSYFKYFNSPTVGDLDGLMEDEDFLDFLNQ